MQLGLAAGRGELGVLIAAHYDVQHPSAGSLGGDTRGDAGGGEVVGGGRRLDGRRLIDVVQLDGAVGAAAIRARDREDQVVRARGRQVGGLQVVHVRPSGGAVRAGGRGDRRLRHGHAVERDPRDGPVVDAISLHACGGEQQALAARGGDGDGSRHRGAVAGRNARAFERHRVQPLTAVQVVEAAQAIVRATEADHVAADSVAVVALLADAQHAVAAHQRRVDAGRARRRTIVVLTDGLAVGRAAVAVQVVAVIAQLAGALLAVAAARQQLARLADSTAEVARLGLAGR